MLAAERLFGEHGIEGTSLRLIALAAGQANNSAVQHHFGTKDGLVQAVFEMRLPELERARWRRLVALEQTGSIGCETLLEALLLPVLEVVSEQDRESFVLFTWRLMLLDPVDHPFARAGDKATASAEIVQRLRECFPELPRDVFDLRFRLSMDVFLNALSEWRFYKRKKGSYRAVEGFWHDILRVAATVLKVPFGPATPPPDKTK
jgi:AcrR family transcriptional regulator